MFFRGYKQPVEKCEEGNAGLCFQGVLEQKGYSRNQHEHDGQVAFCPQICTNEKHDHREERQDPGYSKADPTCKIAIVRPQSVLFIKL